MAFNLTLTTTLQIDSDEPTTVAKRTYSNLEEDDIRGCGILKSATKVLWDSDADGAIDSFQVLVLTTDVDVDVELTTQDGDPLDEFGSFTLAADTAFVLGSDASYYNHGANDVWVGLLGKIDRIRVRESNGAEAKPRLRLYK